MHDIPQFRIEIENLRDTVIRAIDARHTAFRDQVGAAIEGAMAAIDAGLIQHTVTAAIVRTVNEVVPQVVTEVVAAKVREYFQGEGGELIVSAIQGKRQATP